MGVSSLRTTRDQLDNQHFLGLLPEKGQTHVSWVALRPDRAGHSAGGELSAENGGGFLAVVFCVVKKGGCPQTTSHRYVTARAQDNAGGRPCHLFSDHLAGVCGCSDHLVRRAGCSDHLWVF